jgi:hypothetical protein
MSIASVIAFVQAVGALRLNFIPDTFWIPPLDLLPGSFATIRFHLPVRVCLSLSFNLVGILEFLTESVWFGPGSMARGVLYISAQPMAHSHATERLSTTLSIPLPIWTVLRRSSQPGLVTDFTHLVVHY